MAKFFIKSHLRSVTTFLLAVGVLVFAVSQPSAQLRSIDDFFPSAGT